MRTYIGIDPGRNMGWCIKLPNEEIHAGSVDLGKHSSAQLKAAYETLGDILYEIDDVEGEILLCYEEPAMLRGHALIQIQRQIATIMLFCEFEDVPHYPVNQSTLKAWVRRQADHFGKMDKDTMIKAAQEHEPSITDHNAADAYWLARYAELEVKPHNL
jgi:hypothetical protein